MSFRQRMDHAYGRRGGSLAEWPAPPPRPEIGSTALLDNDSVLIVSHEQRRRVVVKFRSGSLLTVAESLLT